LDAGQVARHEIRHHFNLRKEFHTAAAEAVVQHGLPLDIWEQPAMKKAVGILNSAFSDGVSRHIIQKHIRLYLFIKSFPYFDLACLKVK